MNVHQRNFYDNSPSDQNDSDNNILVDLLVKQKVKAICMKTTDPKGTSETIMQYMGIQTRRQKLIGRIPKQ